MDILLRVIMLLVVVGGALIASIATFLIIFFWVKHAKSENKSSFNSTFREKLF